MLLVFSNYLWTLDLSYLIAKRIKEISPETMVVFGGPNYSIEPEEQDQFLKERPAIDFYVYGEGEEAFYQLLSNFSKHNFDIEKVKKLCLNNYHCILNGKFIQSRVAPRIDISKLPSPYLSGLMDKFFDDNWLPLIQTVRGCPFSCTYCSDGNPYWNKVSFRTPFDILLELEYIAQRSKLNKRLNFANSNFGQYKQDLETAKIISEIRKKYGYPQYIFATTGKNNKDMVIDVVKTSEAPMSVAASVQSTDKTVLKNINRVNISNDILIQLVKDTKSIDGNIYSEVILALPGDTKEKHFKSIETIINADLNFIRCYSLMMLRGSILSSKKTREKFNFITKYKVSQRCFGTYKLNGEIKNSIGIEEICVASNTLSFKDYLDCRLFHLIIGIFYNDGIFHELISFIKQYGISPYKLLKTIYDSSSDFTPAFSRLYDNFYREIKEELWDSEDELRKFAERKDVIKKYLAGEYGSNLIFKNRTWACIKYMREIHDIAFRAALKLFLGKIKNKETLSFLDELKKYSLFKKAYVLDTDKTYLADFNFNLPSMEIKNFDVGFINYKLKRPVRILFRHDQNQIDAIQNHIKQFGTTTAGMCNILARVHVKEMYRNARILK